MTNEQIIKYAEYYINNNATIRETAIFFNTSKSSVQNALKDNLKNIDKSLYKKYRVVAERNKCESVDRMNKANDIIKMTKTAYGASINNLIIHKDSFLIYNVVDDKVDVRIAHLNASKYAYEKAIDSSLHLLLKLYWKTKKKIILEPENIFYDNRIYRDFQCNVLKNVFNTENLNNPIVRIYSKIMMAYLKNKVMIC